MIKPTVGRVVWFYPGGKAQVDADQQPNSAIVAYVHDDGWINIAYFDMYGNAKTANNVPLWQGDGQCPLFSFARWMPYQLELQKHLGDLPVSIFEECKSDPPFDNLPRSS